MPLTKTFEQFFTDFIKALEANDDSAMDALEKEEQLLLMTATPEERYEHAIRESHFATGTSIEEIESLAAELAQSDDIELITRIIVNDKLGFNGRIFDKHSKLSVTVIQGGKKPPTPNLH